MQVSEKPVGNVQQTTISNVAKSKSCQVAIKQLHANSLKDHWNGDPSIAAANALHKQSQPGLT